VYSHSQKQQHLKRRTSIRPWIILTNQTINFGNNATCLATSIGDKEKLSRTGARVRSFYTQVFFSLSLSFSTFKHAHTHTGNEGSIDAFWDANGFMTDVLAPKFGAFLLFPEERYYGQSLPFGEESFAPENVKYLSTKQVLEDIVSIVEYIKKSREGADCPVIAFGGSYGGTLTSFLRASHPDIVVGGLASSAPIGYYDVEGWSKHGVDEFTWSEIVYRVYDEADDGCVTAIQRASNLMMRSDEQKLQEIFNMCEKEGLGPRPDSLFMYALESIPQLNYPYAVNSLPAWPVNATCDILLNSKDLLTAAANITTMALFGGSSTDCHETLEEGPGGTTHSRSLYLFTH
jgi:hypothetical protein